MNLCFQNIGYCTQCFIDGIAVNLPDTSFYLMHKYHDVSSRCRC